MDWLLAVLMLLIEIMLVMRRGRDNFRPKARTLGFGSGLMLVFGYYGEIVVTGDLKKPWVLLFVLVVLGCGDDATSFSVSCEILCSCSSW